MSLEHVVDDIKDEARARAEEIRADAEEEAEAIIDEAEADAEAIKDERAAEVESQIDQEREQALSSAKLEAKQQRLEARRDVLADVREDVEAALTELSGDRRESLTRTLIENAATEFDDEATVSVYGRSDDQALIEELLTDYDGFSFGGERDCLGGVVVESDTSRVRVNNTFDSVLNTVWDENLKELSDHLFEQ
ncbi:V-type ATP synthase subunit E [Halonotius terrestris]|uniref:A-type ATP synthase subunit E n=1 Tax=Halonotius terrestris TaxID=2487750 RepID=A0A8J8PBN6_9EURY|nr:V-type ATP synthase subunit E [Halonotius terrestris]TQQ83737.1 V-type ATP synthase subunit E [Halonotius terrestris]